MIRVARKPEPHSRHAMIDLGAGLPRVQVVGFYDEYEYHCSKCVKAWSGWFTDMEIPHPKYCKHVKLVHDLVPPGRVPTLSAGEALGVCIKEGTQLRTYDVGEAPVHALGEREFQDQLIEAVGLMGGLAYHTYDSRRSPKGYPDLTIVTRDRRLIFAELKVEKRKPDHAQRMWLRALPDHQAYLWRDTDWDDAVRIIQEGHRLATGGVVREVDGRYAQVQPRRVSPLEPTCIACQAP